MQGTWQDAVAFLVAVQKAGQTIAKVEARHPIDGDVDVVARDAEQLVTYPSASEAQHNGLGVWRSSGIDFCTHVDEELAQVRFPAGEGDGGSRHSRIWGVRRAVEATAFWGVWGFGSGWGERRLSGTDLGSHAGVSHTETAAERGGG